MHGHRITYYNEVLGRETPYKWLIQCVASIPILLLVLTFLCTTNLLEDYYYAFLLLCLRAQYRYYKQIPIHSTRSHLVRSRGPSPSLRVLLPYTHPSNPHRQAYNRAISLRLVYHSDFRSWGKRKRYQRQLHIFTIHNKLHKKVEDKAKAEALAKAQAEAEKNKPPPFVDFNIDELWSDSWYKTIQKPEVYFAYVYNVNFNKFIETLDPLAQFHALRFLMDHTFLESKTMKKQRTRSQKHALKEAQMLVAATNLATGTPTEATHAATTSGPTVYFNDKHEDAPVVIDTGASMSITPNLSDFVTPLHACKITELNGLSHKSPVLGEGKVEWTVRDVFGSVRTIQTMAYYVPSASIRLLSPQTYFQEHRAGRLISDWQKATFELSDGSVLQFPYTNQGNLPMMLTEPDPEVTNMVGLTMADISFLAGVTDHGSPFSIFLSVADETNQNLTPTQKELLEWHWKLGHANMAWIQSLCRSKRDKMNSSIITTKTNVSSCHAPLCAACQLGKQTRKGAHSQKVIDQQGMAIRANDLTPGVAVSLDQYMSSVKGRLPDTKGKEKADKKYCGGTIFVDHASGAVFTKNQVSLRAGDTVTSKQAFEKWAHTFGVKIKSYRADNVPFNSEHFKKHVKIAEQEIDFSGVGAHHQNGVAERAIRTVVSWARTMMLHAVIHWPDQADLELWPFAVEHAVYLWNHLPKRDGQLAPIEIFSSTKFDSYEHLQRAKVFGCPVYVLEPTLQDGKKLPKWNPRSRRGQNLGISVDHSSTINRILNLKTGHISPQYHVVYDNLFTTVPNAESGGLFNTDEFDQATWERLVQSSLERYADPDETTLPPLDPEWIDNDPEAQRLQEALRRRQLRLERYHRRAEQRANQRRFAPTQQRETRQPMPRYHIPPPRTDPDGATHDPGGHDTEAEAEPPDPDPDPDPDPELYPENEDDPVEEPDPDSSTEEETTTRTGRPIKKPQRFFGDEWVSYSCNNGHDSKVKIRVGCLNEQRLAMLRWTQAVDALRSKDEQSMESWHLLHTDPDENTLEDLHPLAFAAKANAEDNPSWEEAMNGPYSDGYWKAAELELHTLIDLMDAWEIVPREDWMNVLPSTWAFKCKRFPDGTMRKLKARFCVRGDMQQEGVDYFDTFAPVVSWTTVRLLLVMSIMFDLATKQVDYTCAFLHAPIDKDPNYDSLSEEQKKRSGVFVEMPRGFSKPGCVLKLKRSLYGLKQAPRNFFQHLKTKLENKLHFTSCTWVDPCLFVSDKVICLAYVDDTLLYSPKPEWIDEFLEGLADKGMEIEVENSVAGFLGVHIERDETKRTVILTQRGLIKRIVDALGIGHLPVKQTPAAYGALPMDEHGEPPQGKYNYASIVGMIGYLHGHTRPDITFAASQCARFTHNTRRSHEIALERIGQYLKGTMDKGLILNPSDDFNIDCFVDADFAGLYSYEDPSKPSSVKSRTGYVIKYANCPVIWKSKLQDYISLSTPEAEYYALSEAMRALLPFLELVKAVGLIVGLSQDYLTTFKTTVHEDNMGALKLANKELGQSTPRSKHYAIRTHWFRQFLKPNRIVVSKIDTKLQQADIFTKGLRTDQFRVLRRLLMGW